MPRPADGQEPLGALLLPGKLEDLAFSKHARALLSIPRVVALEPPRLRVPGFLREITSTRTAHRLRFPGRVRLLVLYDPAQYPLARALFARTEGSEFWYLPLGPGAVPRGPAATGAPVSGDSEAFDDLARSRATRVLEPAADGTVDDQPLRQRLRELGIISAHAFIPGRPRRA